jgi:16S rRNA (cytosine1402-N4)-methyltransferase
MEKTVHIPVLTQEILALFQPHTNDVLLDTTVGAGGHARAYLEATAPHGRVVGVDADLRALNLARDNLKEFGSRVTLLNAHFANLAEGLNDSIKGGGIVPPLFNHILFDLGVGSHQLADATRAFSFQVEAPLTMRYGLAKHLPPAGLVSLNQLEQRLGRYPDVTDLLKYLMTEELAEILRVYGEERYAKKIAYFLKEKHAQLKTARQLAAVVQEAVGRTYERGRIHPATRTFQALRLAVNRELESLIAALPQAFALAEADGIVAVISFHSLEDRIVKRFFREQSRKSQGEILTKKPLRATSEETRKNPRARSAKLRAMQKRET